VGGGEGREEYDSLKSEISATFLSALVGIGTVRKYLIQSDVGDNTMVVSSVILSTKCTGFSKK
jgi:hypothetical protein